MKNTIDEASWKEVSYFDDLIQPILKMVKDNWDIEASPKGYKEYVETYEECDDMGDEKFDLEFDGLLNTSACGDPINIKLSMPQVAYDDTQQRRDPIHTLISAILSYGIAIGKRQEQTHPDRKNQRDSIKRGLERMVQTKDFEYMKDKAESMLDDFNFFNKHSNL